MTSKKTHLKLLSKRYEELGKQIEYTKKFISISSTLPRGLKTEVARRVGTKPSYIHSIYLGEYTPNTRMCNRIIKVTNEILEELKKNN